MGQQVGSVLRPKGSEASLSKWYWKIATRCSYHRGPINLDGWKLRGHPMSLDLNPLTPTLSFVFISLESNVNHIWALTNLLVLPDLCRNHAPANKSFGWSLDCLKSKWKGLPSMYITPKKTPASEFPSEAHFIISCHTEKRQECKRGRGQRGKGIVKILLETWSSQKQHNYNLISARMVLCVYFMIYK